MNGFWEEYWENVWVGWTPAIMVIFFIMGLKLGGWMSGYFTTTYLYVITKFLLPFILAGCVPFFSTMQKKR